MAWTLTGRNFTKGTYVATANVGDVFTPAQDDIILVFSAMNNTSPHDAVTGWGATWVQLQAPTGTNNNFTVWAARMGASPGSGQVNIDFGAASANHASGVIQISGAHTTAAIGTGGANLFRQLVASSAYDPASPFSITALSAFASTTNLSLTLGCISTNLPITPKAGFTELLESSGATYNPNVWCSYKVTEDGSQNMNEATAGDFDFKYLTGIAIEILEAGGSPPVLMGQICT